MKKLNWGHGILIAIILSVTGILALVFISSTQNIELLDDDYYPKGLVYQEQIEKMKNENALENTIQITIKDEVSLSFPSHFEDPEKVAGLIWFYKASNMKYDIKDSIRLDLTRTVRYPLNRFVDGRYELIVDWTYNQKGYFFKKAIFIEKNQ